MTAVKLVYCLSGESAQPVVAMMRLSIATARHTNPHAMVELLVDRVSLDALAADRSRLLDEVDLTNVHDTPPGPAVLRSRHLKTSMRGAVSGDFLFLDADTVVRKPLRPMWPADTDVAACPNYSRDTLREQSCDEESAYMAAMGWPAPPTYLNSGVVFFADSPRAHAAGRLWHECWSRGRDGSGRHVDQPSFNHAMRASGAEVYVLPHAWNAQINRSPLTAEDASIWHYYHSLQRPADTTFAIEVRRLSGHHPVSPTVVQRLVNADVPWPTDSWLRRIVVADTLRRGRLSPIASLLLAGNCVRAARCAARITIERLTRSTVTR